MGCSLRPVRPQTRRKLNRAVHTRNVSRRQSTQTVTLDQQAYTVQRQSGQRRFRRHHIATSKTTIGRILTDLSPMGTTEVHRLSAVIGSISNGQLSARPVPMFSVSCNINSYLTRGLLKGLGQISAQSTLSNQNSPRVLNSNYSNVQSRLTRHSLASYTIRRPRQPHRTLLDSHVSDRVGRRLKVRLLEMGTHNGRTNLNGVTLRIRRVRTLRLYLLIHHAARHSEHRQVNTFCHTISRQLIRVTRAHTKRHVTVTEAHPFM